MIGQLFIQARRKRSFGFSIFKLFSYSKHSLNKDIFAFLLGKRKRFLPAKSVVLWITMSKTELPKQYDMFTAAQLQDADHSGNDPHYFPDFHFEISRKLPD